MPDQQLRRSSSRVAHTLVSVAVLASVLQLSWLANAQALEGEEVTACPTTEDAAPWIKTTNALAQDDPETAEAIYKAVLAKDPTNECAIRGLAALATAPEDKTEAQQVGQSWTGGVKAWFSPLVDPTLYTLGLLVLLLVLARLITPAVVQVDASAWPRRWGRAAWLGGVALLGTSALMPVIGAQVASRAPSESTFWAVLLGGVAAGLLAWLLLAKAHQTASMAGGPAADSATGQPAGFKAIAAALAIAAVALLVLAGLLDLPTTDKVSGLGLFLSLGVAIAAPGAVLVAAARGQALRLVVDVRNTSGTSDANASHYFVGRLGALGTQPPEGLEIPEQTDVTELPSEALTTLPQDTISKAVFRVLQALRPAAPWHATVSLQNQSTATVALTRNRRSAEPVETLQRHELALPDIDDSEDSKNGDPADSSQELLTACAAHVLLALARRHRELRPGLCGAEKTRSLAMHAIATDPGSAMAASSRTTLLTNAVAEDPGNYLARVADLDRLGTDATPDDQRIFADAAEAELSRVETTSSGDTESGYAVLILRLHFGIAAARVNEALLTPSDVRHPALRRAVIAFDGLVDCLVQETAPAQQLPLRREMRTAAWFLTAGLRHLVRTDAPGDLQTDCEKLAKKTSSWKPVLDGPLTAHTAYDRACWRTLTRQDGSGQPWQEAALYDLRLAVTRPDLRRWARKDPSFDNLRQPPGDEWSQLFKELVGEPPPSSVFDIASLKEHKDQLQSIGLHQPIDLTRVSTIKVANLLKVPPRMVKQWQQIATLAIAEGAAKELPPGLIAALVELDVRTRGDLAEKVRTDLEE